MAPLKGSPCCFTHDARAAARRAKARRKGGQSTRAGYATTPADVGTIAALQGHAGRALADVLRLPNTEARGRTTARLILVALKLIADGDVMQRVEQIEDLLKEDRR